MNPREREEKPSGAANIERTGGGAPRHVSVIDHRIDSRDLFVSTREIIIAHGDDQYRLRLTAQNKLILTK